MEKFFIQYIADNGIPQVVRTDQATVFCGEDFKKLCGTFGVKHIVCSSNDHRGNEKVERLIRTVNERIRAEPEIIKNKTENKLFGELVTAIRVNKNKDGKSPFEKHWNRKPNLISTLIKKRLKDRNNEKLNLLKDETEIDVTQIPRDCDSPIWIKNKIRSGKLNSLFKKKKGFVAGQSRQTIQFVPQGKATNNSAV